MKESSRRRAGSPALERIRGEEQLEWYRMSPEERWRESERLWTTFRDLGGGLEPEPDLQSPFRAPGARRPEPPDGRPGVRPVRRDGV